MNIKTDCNGARINLSGDEVASAIDAWLVAQGVHVFGPRTIEINGELIERGRVYVDPSGYVRGDIMTYDTAQEIKES